MAIGAGYTDDGLVFATITGKVLHPDNVTRAFDRRVMAAGVPRIRLHHTRHSGATLLLAEGVPLKVVSERLGHSSIAITGDLHQHVTEHVQDDAAAKAGRALLGPPMDVPPTSRHHFGTTGPFAGLAGAGRIPDMASDQHLCSRAAGI